MHRIGRLVLSRVPLKLYVRTYTYFLVAKLVLFDRMKTGARAHVRRTRRETNNVPDARPHSITAAFTDPQGSAFNTSVIEVSQTATLLHYRSRAVRR